MIGKLFLMNLLLFCPLLYLRAQTTQQCIVVETSAGQRMEYLLNELPRIIHNDATITLTTTSTSVEFQTSDVAKVYVATSDGEAISEAKSVLGQIQFGMDCVILNGYAPHEAVYIYAIDGKLQNRQYTDELGNLVISLSQLSTGIYIIKTKQQSIKFTKK